MGRFDLLTELMEAFKVKKNPVVEFWFCRKKFINDKTAEFPENFEEYQLYKTITFWADDKEWSCYIRKVIKGVFNDSYWKIAG